MPDKCVFYDELAVKKHPDLITFLFLFVIISFFAVMIAKSHYAIQQHKLDIQESDLPSGTIREFYYDKHLYLEYTSYSISYSRYRRGPSVSIVHSPKCPVCFK